MQKFKLILVGLMLLALCATPAFAQSRFGVQSTGPIEASADLKLPADTWVYGIKVFADASSSVMAIYNAATYNAGTEGNLDIDEIGEATQYDSVEVWYPKPIFFDTGVSVFITTGVGYIFYGPPPAN